MRNRSPNTALTHISTGHFRGRKVLLPVGDDAMRPTKNQVLLAGLNMLGSRVNWPDIRLLDACCGSGQWGLEALSRGAAHVTFADTDTDLLHTNLTTLNADKSTCSIHATDARKLNVTLPFSVIVLDPPYADKNLYTALFNRQNWGTVGTLWLVETARDFTPEFPAFLSLLKNNQYGNTQLFLLEQVA
ncbi:MAG: RsmD family RNA methyltransferase [Alphaproteobacteria bacterium]